VTGYIDRDPTGSPDVPDRPFVWSGPGTLRELAVPPGTIGNVTGHAINNRGEVLGNIGNDVVIWSPDGSSRTIAPPAGQSWVAPADFNDAGTLVSETWQDNVVSSTVRRRADGTMDVTQSGFRPGFLSDVINASGAVAGSRWDDTQRPVVWEVDGTLRTLSTPRGGGEATAINDAGLVAGTYGFEGNSSEVIASAVWRPGGEFVAIPLVPGVDVASQRPYGINNLGQVVGYTNLTNHANDAYYWSETDGVHDLQALLDASGAGWNLQWAVDINEVGQILAVGAIAGRTGFQGVLLTPVPEPGAGAVVLLVCGAVMSRRFRGR
jgi:probable HAF family extracellular repeat protein